MFNELTGCNFDYSKTYKTVDGLAKKLKEYSDFSPRDCMIVVVPNGKNAGRFTAVFAFRSGDNIHWAHRGFMVFG